MSYALGSEIGLQDIRGIGLNMRKLRQLLSSSVRFRSGSVERKDNHTEPDAKNGTTPTKKFCSACGKKSDTLMKCRACKCVWYCDKKCQNKHWREHKKECKPIKVELDKRGGKLDLGSEKDLGPLPDLPPREECPICMHAMPIDGNLKYYLVCCGKNICCGCKVQHEIKYEERTCAFCREPIAKTEEKALARLSKRVDLKDRDALRCMALYYGLGQMGLSVNQAKCIDLLRQAADLGFPGAHYNLGNYYHSGEMGLEQDDAKAKMHWEKAAEGGHLISRHNLGSTEEDTRDRVAAMRHWRLSASGGYKPSIETLIECYERGFLHHRDLSEALQNHYKAKAEMKSNERDVYIRVLKMNGA